MMSFSAVGGPAAIAAAVIAYVASQLVSSIYWGKVFHEGEFDDPVKVMQSIYQVQMIEVDGQWVPALVAVHPEGSTIIASGTGIGYIIGNVGSDVLVGDDNIQTITANAGADYLEARAGADNLIGGDGNDHLNGGDGADVLQGDTGDDIIFGEEGNDTVIAGAGSDFVHTGTGDDIINGGEGNDYLLASGGNDAVAGDLGDDSIDGGYGDDSITLMLHPASRRGRTRSSMHCCVRIAFRSNAPLSVGNSGTNTMALAQLSQPPI